MIDLSPRFLATVKSILERRVPEREVWAFGSRVKGTARKFSDLDLAILGETPLPLSVVAALANDFDDSDLPVKVDIVEWARVRPAFRELIRQDAAVLQRAAGGPLPPVIESPL